MAETDGPQLSIYLLGTFHVAYQGKTVAGFRSEKERTLLAYLALERALPIGREELLGLLWPELPQTNARNNLRVTLHRLQKNLPVHVGEAEPILAGRHAVQLNPAADIWLDVAAFQAHVDAARELVKMGQASHPERLRHLTAAAELYRDEFLKGFAFDDSPAFVHWSTVTREQIHRLALAVSYELAQMHLRRGELRQALLRARRQLELEPWREEAHRQLMGALARSGQRSAALAQFHNCRRILAEELAVQPAEETVRLYEHIEIMAPAQLRNIPAVASPFIGRRAELDQVVVQLSDPGCRLLTLLGPGGIGKTRLALQAAETTALAYLHGVCFVPLSPGDAKGQLVRAIGLALGLSHFGQTDPVARLLDFLREKELLLVLDSSEHVLDQTPFLVTLLEQAPQLSLLVTSRERLNLLQEHVLEVGGLDYPHDASQAASPLAYSGGHLFMECARRLLPAYEPSETDATAIAAICQLVDGMPLAIELAASWMRILTPLGIAEEIRAGIGILSSSQPDVPAGHRSMEAVFAQSWRRLSGEERRVLACLSLFRGSFDRAAAEAVAGTSLPLLTALVDKSLLQRRTPHGEAAARPAPFARYGLHDLLRYFSRRKLNEDLEEEAATLIRFITYYTDFLAQRSPHLRGPEQPRALAEVRQEYGNVRAALREACRLGQVTSIGKSLDVLLRFFAIAHDSFYEAEQLFGRIVDAIDKQAAGAGAEDPDIQRTLAKALAYHGWFYLQLGQFERAEALSRRAHTLAVQSAEREIEYGTLNSLGILAREAGQYGQAEHCLRRALALAEGQGNLSWEASISGNLAHLAGLQGKREVAEEYYERALNRHRELGDAWGICGITMALGQFRCDAGELSLARALIEEALAIAQQIHFPHGQAKALLGLGSVAIEEGKFEEAKRHFMESLALCRQTGAGTYIEMVQERLAELGNI